MMERNMRKILLIATCASFIAGAATGKEAKPSFVADGELSICTSGGFPPMEFYKNPGDTSLVGFEVDVMTKLAENWGVPAKFIVGDFKGHLPSLAANRCDVVASGISITEERLKSYDGVPYFDTAIVLLVQSANQEVKTPDDLSGRVVAIEAGTNYENRMAELNAALTAAGKAPAVIQAYPSAAAVIEQVLVGRAVATIVQDTAAAYRMIQMPDRMKVVYTYDSDDRYGIYLRKNADDLQAVQDGIRRLQKDGTFKTLLEKWTLPAGATDREPVAN